MWKSNLRHQCQQSKAMMNSFQGLSFQKSWEHNIITFIPDTWLNLVNTIAKKQGICYSLWIIYLYCLEASSSISFFSIFSKTSSQVSGFIILKSLLLLQPYFFLENSQRGLSEQISIKLKIKVTEMPATPGIQLQEGDPSCPYQIVWKMKISQSPIQY